MLHYMTSFALYIVRKFYFPNIGFVLQNELLENERFPTTINRFEKSNGFDNSHNRPTAIATVLI